MKLHRFTTNRYNLLGLLSLCILALLIVFTFQSVPKTELLFTNEIGVGIKTAQFKIIVVVYFILLSVFSFVIGQKAELPVPLFWLYLFLLAMPLPLLAAFVMKPELTIALAGNYRSNYAGSYYNYASDYGLINISLISLNVIGLLIFGFRSVRELTELQQSSSDHRIN